MDCTGHSIAAEDDEMADGCVALQGYVPGSKDNHRIIIINSLIPMASQYTVIYWSSW
jgi:hypothetical protein